MNKTFALACVSALICFTVSAAEPTTLTVSSLHFVPANSNIPALTDERLARWPDFPDGWPATSWFAPVQLPQGALISSIAMTYCAEPNTFPAMSVAFLTKCTGQEQCEPAVEFLLSESAEPCRTVVKGLPWPPAPIDNTYNTYYLRAAFSNQGTGKLVDVRIRYVEPIAQSPEVPTFSDVPTSHVFYKFVEHLYAVGAVVGCGDGRFCPDDPVTRGQVAAIVVRALGKSSVPPYSTTRRNGDAANSSVLAGTGAAGASPRVDD